MQQKEPASRVEFAGMVAVVTGAAQGIGLAIAEDLHARGAHLILVDCNVAGLSKAVASMRGTDLPTVDAIVTDLAEPRAIAEMAAEAARLVSSVDVLVNNAGIEVDLPFNLVTAEVFDRILAVNLRAPLLVSQSLAPLFPASGGSIVNISSIHASHAFPNAIPYACSKAGLVALTRNMALELAPRNVRVNAVCPGYIDTPMWDDWLHASLNPKELARQTAELHPLRRRGVPADVAAAVAYFASPQSSWVTGTQLVVDGGLTIRAHP